VNRFEGRVALVTGAARGIGAACAKRLAAEGAKVAVCDLDAASCEEVVEEIKRANGEAKAIAADVTDRESVEKAVQGAVDAYGGLDVLVCCAGIIRDNLIFKMSDDDWFAVINTHLTGSFYAARAAQKVMVERKYGRMIFLSSTSALGNRGQTNYSTAKAGLQGMAKTLAIELGKFNITANAIAPGFIETRMTQQTAERMGVDFEQFKQAAASQIPVQRVGQPEDIAAAVAYLCSEEAGFVSGQVLYVRGGP
jgi:3-oxoacyl-[acyl-carrier protein] reductase